MTDFDLVETPRVMRKPDPDFRLPAIETLPRPRALSVIHMHKTFEIAVACPICRALIDIHKFTREEF